MCITAQEVRDTSVTGEFDALADDKILARVKLVCPLYANLKAKAAKLGIVATTWRMLVALHVAHSLHEQIAEAANDGKGAVQSESFSQVGSRSYATLDPDSDDWWKGSSYGRLWRRHWDALPAPGTAVRV